MLEKQFRARKRTIGSSWRLDETYVKVKGCWKYLYRAVDNAGATVDFLLTAKRDRKAALRFGIAAMHEVDAGYGDSHMSKSLEPEDGTQTMLDRSKIELESARHLDAARQLTRRPMGA